MGEINIDHKAIWSNAYLEPIIDRDLDIIYVEYKEDKEAIHT